MSDEEEKIIRQVKTMLENATPFDMPPSRYNALETMVNLIEKQQKKIETLSTQNAKMSERHFRDSEKLKNSVSKDKIREKMQEYYEKASPYDCDTADYKQSQEIGGWNALRKLLEE